MCKPVPAGDNLVLARHAQEAGRTSGLDGLGFDASGATRVEHVSTARPGMRLAIIPDGVVARAA
eukprot:8681701-Lingulodinium_polyedra.AAC.1